ncbi:MAG: class I SAM-dependent methyltransferase [Gammaproteobacteria bacterium]|nr:class I SAM-dependent methyltransferase [Gammaproteobacteria bacterium]
MWNRIRQRLFAGDRARTDQQTTDTTPQASASQGDAASEDGARADAIAREFEQRKPWVTRFWINGVAYGGAFDAMNDARLEQFRTQFPDVKTILELGALEGGHSFGLAAAPQITRVVGLEGRASNIERARLVQKLLGLGRVEFHEVNLEQTDLADWGRFDAVFCSGLLYHLPEPWKLLDLCAKVSPRFFMWTHYAAGDGNVEVNGYRGKWFRESGLGDPLSGMSQESFWPTLPALEQMLRHSGYNEVRIIHDDAQHPHGPAVTLAATAG